MFTPVDLKNLHGLLDRVAVKGHAEARVYVALVAKIEEEIVHSELPKD